MIDMIAPIVELFFIVSCVFCFVSWYKNYKSYYEYMRSNHRATFLRIINKDPLVRDIGDWIRWPVGSGYIILSSFNLGEDHGDNTIKSYKNMSVTYIILLVFFFVIALFLPMFF